MLSFALRLFSFLFCRNSLQSRLLGFDQRCVCSLPLYSGNPCSGGCEKKEQSQTCDTPLQLLVSALPFCTQSQLVFSFGQRFLPNLFVDDRSFVGYLTLI